MTTTRKPTKKRVSMAAFARRLAELEALQQQPPRELPAAAQRALDNHTSSRLSADKLTHIKPFLHEVITASTLSGGESVRKHCTHLSELAAYALDRGMPLDLPTVMTTPFIDEYVRLGMADSSDRLKAGRRTRLLALAANVNPGPNSPARPTPLGHVSVKPCYTPTELAVIRRVCQAQPTAIKTRDLSIVVGLGAGAGGDSVDLRALNVRHVEDLGELGLQVRFQGPRPRLVPVRFAFEAIVRSTVAGRNPNELLLGKKQDRRNTAARAVEVAALYKVPHIEPARLRATWLADLMTDTVPIGLILQAAGLKSARTLAELLPHLGPWLEHKGLSTTPDNVLRGGSR